jgi:hypothetical protein
MHQEKSGNPAVELVDHSKKKFLSVEETRSEGWQKI